MTVNHHLKQFGLNCQQRNLIIHVDDIGMSQAGLAAFDELYKAGAVSSGSAMAPCPWFPATVRWYHSNPDADLGLHVTLTSEWNDFRWGPLSRQPLSSSLTDETGRYFHQTREEFVENATLTAVSNEIQSQFDFAALNGLHISHLDCHMYSCLQPMFLPDFLQFAVTHAVPVLVSQEHLIRLGSKRARHWVEKLQGTGLPIFDHIFVMPKCLNVADYVVNFKAAVSNLPPGLSCLLTHPAKDGAEVQYFAPEARYQVVEFHGLLEVFSLDVVRQQGINLINYQNFVKADEVNP